MEGLVDGSGSSTTAVYLPTKEDDCGGVHVSIVSLPSSANASTVVNSLRLVESYWRNKKKKALWLKLPNEYSTFVHPAYQVGFSIHQTESTYMMLVLRLRGEEPSSTLPANASNQVGVGPCFGSNDLQELDTEQSPQSHGNCLAAERGSTSGELGPAIQPSLLAFNFAPASMGYHVDHSNTQATLRRCFEGSAVGGISSTTSLCNWQTNEGVEVFKTPAEPVNETKRRAHTPDKNTAQHKRSRGPNWTSFQKLFLLKGKLRYQLCQKHTAGKPGDWFHSVSKSYLDEHGIQIDPGKWQDQWDTLTKQFKAIRVHEEEIQSGRSTCVSFWKMSEDERSNARRNGYKNLPRVFDHEMYQLVGRINQIQENLPEQEIRGQQVGTLRQSSPAPMASTITDSVGPSDGNRPSPSIQVSTEPLGQALPFSDNLACSTQGNQQPEPEKLDLPIDHLIQTRIVPLIRDAIAGALQPVIAELQIRKEDEQKNREKMWAVQQEQLAMMRQEIQLLIDLVFPNNSMATAGSYEAEAVVAANVEASMGHRQQADRFSPIEEYLMNG